MSIPRHPLAGARIELLYFDGCPGAAQLLPLLRALAERTGARLDLQLVETPEHAQAACFLGSPTIRVNGRDIEPGAEQRTDYGLKCRLYPTTTGERTTVPPSSWIETALTATPTDG